MEHPRWPFTPSHCTSTTKLVDFFSYFRAMGASTLGIRRSRGLLRPAMHRLPLQEVLRFGPKFHFKDTSSLVFCTHSSFVEFDDLI